MASAIPRKAYEAELKRLQEDLVRMEDDLRVLLLPRDPNEGKDVIVEIRGAEGGEEANLFARDLFDMYQAYALRAGWKLEVLSAAPSDLGGFNEVTFVVRGDGAWSHLKFEGGPHRDGGRAHSYLQSGSSGCLRSHSGRLLRTSGKVAKL